MEEPHRQPPPLPQTPLSYQSPGTAAGPVVHQSAWPILLRFFGGLLLGTIVSAIVWIAGWELVNKSGGWPLLVVPGVKLVAGIVFLCIRGWRSFGAGILVSIALGVLVLMGSCMAHIDLNHLH